MPRYKSNLLMTDSAGVIYNGKADWHDVREDKSVTIMGMSVPLSTASPAGFITSKPSSMEASRTWHPSNWLYFNKSGCWLSVGKDTYKTWFADYITGDQFFYQGFSKLQIILGEIK